jgi:hypothetical protein
MFASVYLLAVLAPLVATQTVPAQLFSSLIPQKVLATAKALPGPIQYPQYTDTSAGAWQYFVPDTWTSVSIIECIKPLLNFHRDFSLLRSTRLTLARLCAERPLPTG